MGSVIFASFLAAGVTLLAVVLLRLANGSHNQVREAKGNSGPVIQGDENIVNIDCGSHAVLPCSEIEGMAR